MARMSPNSRLQHTTLAQQARQRGAPQQPSNDNKALAMARSKRVIPQQDSNVVELRQKCQQRMVALDNARLSWWTKWRKLARWINPRLARFLETPNEQTRGSLMNQRILDSTALTSSQRFAAGLLAGVCSPARPWFKLRITGSANLKASGAVKRWLAQVEERMRQVLAESNFYRSMAHLFEQIGVFGTASMLMYEDYQDIVRFFPVATGEYYLAVDDRLETSTFARLIAMTTAEIVGRFGLANVSEGVRQTYDQGQLDTEYMIGHLIMPNDKIWGVEGLEDKPFIEVYWLWAEGANELLEVQGYYERPSVSMRWNVTGNDAYGRGLGDDALGPTMQLQIVTKRKGQVIEKIANPPMTAPVALENKPTTTIPGAVTFVPPGDANAQFKPAYQVDHQAIPAITADNAATKQEIKTIFHEDLFLMISQMEGVQPRNNLEIAERKEEKMLMLGPALERIHDEGLRLVIKRLYAMMERKGILPEVPAELEGVTISIEFVSVLAQAQRAASLTSIERLFAFAGSLAAIFPGVADKLDADAALEEYADVLGAPPKIVVSEETVNAMRQARQKQADQARAMEATKIGADAGKVMSETNVGGGMNALQKITGMAA